MADSDKRLRYFNGQFLQEKDFNDEQAYHLDRQRRHNQHLHTYGIADGLLVTGEVGAASVTVSPGTAIDGEGRMIVLAESDTVELGDLTGPALLVISYDEQESDLASVGDKENTRWWERPKLQVIAEAGALSPSEYIQIAKLDIANGKLKNLPNASVRIPAGKVSPGSLKVQNPIGSSAQFVKDQNGNQSSLAIGTGKVGIGTSELGCVLTVAGNVSSAPIAEARSQGDEASIRYANNSGEPWHVGSGGHGGAKNFFFWNQSKGVVGTITPEGDLSVKGKILVAGTVDGRDVSADGAKLDALASSAGILKVPGPLGDALQFVKDQTDRQSPVMISTKDVEVNTESEQPCIFKVVGNVSSAPLMEVRSRKNEATIRYLSLDNADKVAWHVGTGGLGGAKNFFFWNDSAGPVGKVVAAITPDGSLTAKGLKVNADTPGMAFKIDGNAGAAPLAEVSSQSTEASIRYACKDNNVPWHVGMGGHSGANNFFFWNQSKGIAATITPDGSLTLKGGLTVNGGLSMRRIIVRSSFGQLDADGTIKTIDATFQPKFISMEGRAHAWLGATGRYLSYGGALGGLCHVSESGGVSDVAGHGPHIVRLPEAPYIGFYNAMHAVSPRAFGSVSFVDHVDKLQVYIEILVESITSNGFRLQLVRKTTEANFKAPDVFGLDMAFAVLG